MNEELKDTINNIIDNESLRVKTALREIFNLLFFKDFTAAHIDPTIISNLINLIDDYVVTGSKGEEYYNFKDINEVYNIIRDIRNTLDIKATGKNPFNFTSI